MTSAPARVGQVGVQSLGHGRTPVLVEVLAAGVLDLGAHLEAIRLHQIERAEHAVEPERIRTVFCARVRSRVSKLAASMPA